MLWWLGKVFIGFLQVSVPLIVMLVCQFFLMHPQVFSLARLIHGAGTADKNLMMLWIVLTHCESRKGLWLPEEAASQPYSFRDAEPQPVISPNAKKNIFPKQTKEGISTSLSPTDLCLPITVWQ